MNEKLMGVFAPITTPFTADGTVDYADWSTMSAPMPKAG